MKTPNASQSVTPKKNFTDNLPKVMRINQKFGLIDLGLLVVTLLLIFTELKITSFHLVFFLLTFGAFYWSLRAFVLRASFWVTLTTALLAIFIRTHAVHGGELVEIPLLTSILILVFIIARQRAQAEEALLTTNENLESRVEARTAELVKANIELQREISERRQTVKTLRESEERYRSLVELSFETIAVFDQKEILYINPAGIKLLGAASSEGIVGKSVLDFVHPDNLEQGRSRLQEVMETGRGLLPVEQKLVQLDGTPIDVEVAAIPISYQGRPVVQIIIRDISKRKEAEAVRVKERTRIAHDLHDSLGQSLGYLHLKLDEFVGRKDLQEGIEIGPELARMRDEANAAYELVRGMLAAALPPNMAKLSTVLRSQAKLVGQQYQFKVQLIE